MKTYKCDCTVQPLCAQFYVWLGLKFNLSHKLCIGCKTGLVALLSSPLLLSCAFQQAELPDSSFSSFAQNPVSGSGAQDTNGKHAKANDTSLKVRPDALPSKGLSQSLSEPATFTDNTNKLLSRFENATALSGSGVKNESAIVRDIKTRADNYVPTFSVEAIDTPIEALLFSLSRDAALQLRINGSLSGDVSIYAQDLSLEKIMHSLAEQVPLSWQLKDNVLSVWAGARYTHSYTIDYLNISRVTRSSVGLATQVGTINSTSDNGSVANSSQTQVENTSEHQFWQSLDTDVQSMMGQSGDAAAAGQFSINAEAGLLTVYAKPAIHRSIQEYLDLLQDSSQRQVLIEATVVEVALSDSFDAGVDWQLLANDISGLSAAQVLVGAPVLNAQSAERIGAPSGLVSFVHQGGDGDVRATLSLLEQFGDVRIMSRPRIIALNNQSSVLKVVDNRVYFTVNVQRRKSEGEADEIVTETEIHTVPVGLVMNVTPQISRQGQVMLNVRPTLSRILGFVNDPNPELALANVRNGVPEIQVREMESMLQVQSGDVAIIGGLMQETQTDNDTRLPGLGSLPGIGRLFSRKASERRQTELLIVLRPTVLKREGVLH